MLTRWPSSPAHTLSSCGLLTRWGTVMGVLMPLWMQQQRRPARNAGPLTRPRRPRRAVVRWLSLDSLALWCYTECSSLCFCILCFVALGPAADAVERRKNPSPALSPGGGFLLSAGLLDHRVSGGLAAPPKLGGMGGGGGPLRGAALLCRSPCGACVVAPLRTRCRLPADQPRPRAGPALWPRCGGAPAGMLRRALRALS